MRGIIELGLGAALVAAGMSPTLSKPADAREHPLACLTPAALAMPGHHSQRFAQRHLYAPARDAMFFSHPESTCRWKAAQHRRS